MEIVYKAICWKNMWPCGLDVVIFRVPLVASRHNIHQRRGKILPKHMPWSDCDFKIVLSVIEKRFIKNNVIRLF